MTYIYFNFVSIRTLYGLWIYGYILKYVQYLYLNVMYIMTGPISSKAIYQEV